MTKRVCIQSGCPRLIDPGRSRCDLHERERDRARGSSTARGYHHEHRQTRAALLPDAYGQRCPLCGERMWPHQALDLDHSTPLAVDDTARGDRITHASCNRGRRAAPQAP